MQVEKIELNPKKARELYRKYKTHQHYQSPMDWEVQRTYQLIAQGKTIIKAMESIVLAGADENHRPKLAIAPATAEKCYWEPGWDGGGDLYFSRDKQRTYHYTQRCITLPKSEAFPKYTDYNKRMKARGEAIPPIIPTYLKPKRGLQNYHILWEAEWGPTPPVDPYLLRRIGKADLWLVVAAWDLTEVERAVMSSRIAVH